MLTDTYLKSIHKKSHAVVFEKADADGLSIRVSVKGKIAFQHRFSLGGKGGQRMPIGTYPATSLKEARERSKEIKGIVESGRDPRIVKKQEIARNTTEGTLNECFAKWYELACKPGKECHAEIRRSFDLHVFPKIGNQPIDTITFHQWMDLLEPLAKKSPTIADRILTNTKQMYKWLIRRKMAAGNPLNGINAGEDLGVSKNASFRALSDTELRNVLEALYECQIAPKNKLIVLFVLIYGCRPHEIYEAKKSQFDLEKGIWTIPPAAHKTGKSKKKINKPLVRPITTSIKPLIQAAMQLSNSDTHLFTCEDSDKLMGRTSTLQFAYHIMQWLRRHRDINMDHWSLYDLRKTARTNWSTLTQPHVAELMLGHKLPGEWQIYDLYHYLPEQERALDAWMNRLLTMGYKPDFVNELLGQK